MPVGSLRRRLATGLMHARLEREARRRGRPLFVDYGDIKLLYSGDGDLQEIHYHLNHREWWQHEMQVISPYVQDGDCVVDVGANVGFISVLLARLVGPGGQVHAFEPDPSSFR